MKPKRLNIAHDKPIQEWMNDNKNIIMETIYENIFDFAGTDEEDRIVLQLVSEPKLVKTNKLKYMDTIEVSFTITKDDLDTTLDKLLVHMESAEEYEKCSKIVKLKDGLLKP